jgi:Ca2+-binding EF-hand superfamily protein
MMTFKCCGIFICHFINNDNNSDEAVVESIFNCCDKEQTGYVRASVLVEFLLNYAYESHEIRLNFSVILLISRR